MPRFSANLGFLWANLSLPDAVRAAAKAGFAAVECHWPYETDPAVLKAALDETGLPLLGLNTSRGNADAAEFGLSALPGREADARDAIDAAFDYAEAVGAQAVHVMAGCAEGNAAHSVFEENLKYACVRAQNRTVLIEPINTFDVPGYYLSHLHQARDIIASVGAENLKLMFDCYHVARMEGDVVAHLEKYLPMVGHIQFAGVPSRTAPDQGSLDYVQIFKLIDRLQWAKPLGAEYKSKGDTDASLSWIKQYR